MVSKLIPQGSFIVLWAGENPLLHTMLVEQLQGLDIPFADKTLGDDEVAPTSDPLPIDWKPRFGFEVAVLSGDFAVASQVLEKLLDEEPADIEIPAQDGISSLEPPMVVATEEHPTVEVWSGSNDRVAQFLVAAMQENGIPIHLENPGELTRILVSGLNQGRAREIVREVVQGAPPE
jgi:hypothetical protein